MSVAVDPALAGAVPAGSLVARQQARVAGRITFIEVSPADAPARLVARVSDDSGSIDVVFLGRRTIPGIEPGALVSVTGRVALDKGALVMFNPAYELASR